MKIVFLIGTLLLSLATLAQKLNFPETLKKSGHQMIPLAIENTPEHLRLLNSQNIPIKYSSRDWIHFTASPTWIEGQLKQKSLTDFYFEYAPPTLLDDTARVRHDVDRVHEGLAPLRDGFTGKGVIVGVVDSGLDHDHPDFIAPNGSKRLIRYWDHTISNPTQVLQPYNYGQIWYRQDIVDGTITSNETNSGHGTTVTGIAVGNGLGNGRNKGFAPEADIIAIKTNFALPNWTLTIADACDYVFRVADSLGKPAIVNLSLGSYLGSHDAKDPAGIYIDQLLDQKAGRLVICAAGNSGNWSNYHAQSILNDETSFTWFKNNPDGRLGANTVFFDLWTDTSLTQFDYHFSAINPSANHSIRGSSNTFTIRLDSLVGLHRDTIRNNNGQRIATLQIFQNRVGPNYQMQFVARLDSTSYFMEFNTQGTGKYDLWSGLELRFNEIVEDIPTASDYPRISQYVLPDNLQTIVSSWNCSEKVVSVGNLRNRLGHIDKNGNQYYPSDMTSPGTISPSSSRGPTRRGYMKPDVSSSGEVSLAAGPSWILNSPSWNGAIDEEGLHVRNGGTSMASPTVAGAAALYLEKCATSSWSNFKQDIFVSSTNDAVTGIVPNVQYGYGKLNVSELINRTSTPINFIGNPVLCQGPTTLSTSPPLQNYTWSTGSNSSNITIAEETEVYVFGKNPQGCTLYSDTILVDFGDLPDKPTITQSGNVLTSSEGPNYQWYLNDGLLFGEVNQSITPVEDGYYSVSFTNEEGCSNFSNAYQFVLSVKEEKPSFLKIHPNPAHNKINIVSTQDWISTITVLDNTGRIVIKQPSQGMEQTIDISHLAKGGYILKIQTTNEVLTHKFIKD